jgi:hypothetical protein
LDTLVTFDTKVIAFSRQSAYNIATTGCDLNGEDTQPDSLSQSITLTPTRSWMPAQRGVKPHMSVQGTFDDRNDARLAVKLWLGSSNPESYRREQIRHRIAEVVKADRDPVDRSADSWREGSYGAMIGILEFIGEEISRVAQQRDDSGCRQAYKDVLYAASCLPHDPSDAYVHVCRASTLLSEANSDSAASSTVRVKRALQLAQELLHPQRLLPGTGSQALAVA